MSMLDASNAQVGPCPCSPGSPLTPLSPLARMHCHHQPTSSPSSLQYIETELLKYKMHNIAQHGLPGKQRQIQRVYAQYCSPQSNSWPEYFMITLAGTGGCLLLLTCVKDSLYYVTGFS
jgi:hypothetical protein